MVRLLTVEEYGEYRDFLLYGMLLHAMVDFCINSSLAYFVPKDPERQNVYFTQATLFVLCTSIFAALLVLLFSAHFPSSTIETYKYALCLYILFVSNLDAWEVFWIAKRQIANVVYYSLSRLGTRTTVVIVAAYLTHDVGCVIWTLVAFEALRLLVMSGYAAKQKVLVTQLDAAATKAQIAFFGPLGAAQLVFTSNYYIGQLFVSAVLGPAVLALYVVGTYLNPIIHIFRSSIGDVIMPEIMSKRGESPKLALGLWQHATVIYCAVMFPIAVLFLFYADVVVVTLFTSAYAEAIPIFQIFVFLLIRESFDFSLPLRVVNRTKVFFLGNVLALMLNITLLLALYDRFGILAPPLAMMITRFLSGIYLAAYVMKYCEYTLPEMLPWYQIAKVTVICMICIPILYVAENLPLVPLGRAVIGGALYIVVLLGLLSRSGIPDISQFILGLIGRARSRKA